MESMVRARLLNSVFTRFVHALRLVPQSGTQSRSIEGRLHAHARI